MHASCSVLMVDDAAERRTLVREFLAKEEFNLLEATGGAEALECFAAHPVDLILLDSRMAPIDGYEVARRIRRMPGGDRVSILLLSGVDDPASHEEAMSAGADDFLASFNRTSLVLRVRSLLRISEVRRRLEEAHAVTIQQRDELMEARQRQRQITSMVVHDLKSPLTGVLMSAEYLAATEPLSDPGREVMDDLLDAGAVMKRLILDLLDLARSQDGHLRPQAEDFDLTGLWRTLLDRAALRVGLAGVVVDLDLGPAEPWVRADRSLLRRVCENLFENALRYSPAGSRISIRSTTDPGGVTLRVADEGPGVAAALRDQIFEPWRQSREDRQRGEGNRGLGLAFCKLAVDAQGGRIWVEESQSGGSGFCVWLPAARRSSMFDVPESPAAPPHEAAPDEPAPKAARTHPIALSPPPSDQRAPWVDEYPPSPGRGRVLLVDDHPFLLRALRRLLVPSGHVLVSAPTGEAALALIEREEFDIVVTDIHMPGMSGLDLLAAVRARPMPVPVILISSSPDLDSALAAVGAGAFRYLVRPLDERLLRTTVDRAIRMARLARIERELAGLGERAVIEADRREKLAAKLDRSLEHLRVAWQPIVRWSERRVVAYEALMRPRGQALPNPGAVLSAAEDLGRLGDVAVTVQRAIVAVIPDAPADVQLFVNLHPRDLFDPALSAPDGPLVPFANRISLEITERAALDARLDEIESRVRELRERGFQIVVDDLGAGYAGLASFAQLAPDVVKLDLALVRDVHLDPVRQRLIRAMLVLCEDLEIDMIAEGVETREERDCLVDMGCDLLQGYFFARPHFGFCAANSGSFDGPERAWPASAALRAAASDLG